MILKAIPAYCSGDFLEGVYKRLDKPLAEYLLDDSEDLWIAELYKFIHGNCALIIDLDYNELLRRSTDKSARDYNPNFKKLWKNGKIAFISSPEEFNKMHTNKDYFKNKTNEIFLTNFPKEFCSGVEKKYGLVCSCNESMDVDIPRLFRFEIMPLTKKGTIQSWDFLKQNRYPSNSAVIADNYIFKKKDLLCDNLYAILKNLLPSELDEEFHLTIFTREVNDLESIWSLVYDSFLKNLPYKVNLSIGKASRGSLGLHDRDIITNYCWYHSGAGFTLFQKSDKGTNVLHNTKVFVFPVTHMGYYLRSGKQEYDREAPAQANYFSALNIFKKIWRDLPDKMGLYKTFVGERRNRLLDS